MTPPEILYADNHLLAINKPAGLLTQPSPGCEISAEKQAKAWIKQTCNKPGDVFCEAVHRIDREVSGIVLFARTSKALSRLNEQMRERKIVKIYHALVEGAWSEPAGELTHLLKHGCHRAEPGEVSDPDAKTCVLRYRLLAQSPACSHLEIELVTGRYHQIRAQLAAAGHPILGDAKYGAKHPFAPHAIALHHQRFICLHPVKRETLVLEAPPPETWRMPGT